MKTVFLKFGARSADISTHLEVAIQVEYQKLFKEKRYQSFTTQQKVIFKEQIFNK